VTATGKMPDEIEIPTMANAEDGKNPSAAGGQIRRSKSKHIKQCSICGQDCFYNYYSVQSCEGPIHYPLIMRIDKHNQLYIQIFFFAINNL
jgi:hypothetical protein